jgi:hypothetical protein
MRDRDNERELVLKICCELGLIERHFNTIQSGYRALASTWMLAAVAAIGFVIQKELTLGVPKELLIGVIGAGGGIGVYLLWVLDLLFSQRLLDAAYFEARTLEDKHHWLPPTRNNMRDLLGGKGLSLVVWYYIAGMELMFLIAGTTLVWLVAPRPGTASYVVGAVVYVALLTLIPVHMKMKTSRTPKLEDQIRDARRKRAQAAQAKIEPQ